MMIHKCYIHHTKCSHHSDLAPRICVSPILFWFTSFPIHYLLIIPLFSQSK